MNLLSLCEGVWRRLNPNGSAQSDIKLEEVIEAGIHEFAAAFYIFSKNDGISDGGFEIPSEMLVPTTLDVVDNQVDLSKLNVADSLSNDQWLQQVGTFDCPYIKSSLNQEKILKDDDSIGDKKTFFRVGKKLVFPRGTYDKKVHIIYASMGEGLDPSEIEVNAYVASKVRDKLYQTYGIQVPADHTANSNSNN